MPGGGWAATDLRCSGCRADRVWSTLGRLLRYRGVVSRLSTGGGWAPCQSWLRGRSQASAFMPLFAACLRARVSDARTNARTLSRSSSYCSRVCRREGSGFDSSKRASVSGAHVLRASLAGMPCSAPLRKGESDRCASCHAAMADTSKVAQKPPTSAPVRCQRSPHGCGGQSRSVKWVSKIWGEPQVQAEARDSKNRSPPTGC